MGYWGVEPFGNDDAADFALELEDVPAAERVEMIGAVLERVAGGVHRSWELPRAVAAAALVAAQCPGGEPVISTGSAGPSAPMPPLPGHLRGLALRALDEVIAESSELAVAWDESPSGPAWRRTIADLRRVLDPPQRETLF